MRLAVTPEVLFEETHAILLNRIRTRFRDGTDPHGIPWVESMAAKKRKSLGIGNKTLFDTGRLFHSIQAYKNKTGYAIGTNVPYAVYHQRGEGQVTRVFLGFSSDDSDIIKSLLLRVIQRRKKT
jgi:phage gpG-like protein